jgi:hypothetical protein
LVHPQADSQTFSSSSLGRLSHLENAGNSNFFGSTHHENHNRLNQMTRQGIEEQAPAPRQLPSIGTIHRKMILGGIINDFYRKSPQTAMSAT